MCLKKFLLKQTSSKINNSGEKFCNNLSCFFLTPITPVLLSGNLLNYTGCSIITSRTIRVKYRILKQFLLYFKTLSNLEQCPTWVWSPLYLNSNKVFTNLFRIARLSPTNLPFTKIMETALSSANRENSMYPHLSNIHQAK
jgi:hypothetical protein